MAQQEWQSQAPVAQPLHCQEWAHRVRACIYVPSIYSVPVSDQCHKITVLEAMRHLKCPQPFRTQFVHVTIAGPKNSSSNPVVCLSSLIGPFSDCRGGVDLNRDFPDPLWLGRTGLDPTGNEQPETLALMKWTTKTHFVASGSMHEVGLCCLCINASPTAPTVTMLQGVWYPCHKQRI